MKVLLIRPEPPKQTIGLQHVMICEPLELEYLASNIPDDIKEKIDIKIYDMILEKKSYHNILTEEKPEFVLFTGYITHVGTIKKMSKLAKEIDHNIKTGVGGVHAEVVPGDFKSPYIDHIYAENSIVAFNKTLRELLVEKGEIAQLEEKEPANISKLVHPDRGMVERYRKDYYYMFHNPCSLIKTSYGCPYNCSFCFCKSITKGKYFVRDLEDVLDELEKIEEEEIYIVDDDFLYDRRRIFSFIDGLKDRNIQKKYLVYGRADFIVNNIDVIKAFKNAGLQAVIVGIESARAKDLQEYRKGTTTDINERCIEILRDMSIELYATMILPLDFTKKDFQDLRNWVRGMDIRFVNLQPLTPLPGTEIFSDYEDKLIVEREDYAKWDMAHVVLEPEHMYIKEFYREILLSYYKIVMRPKHMVYLLKRYGLKECMKMLKGSAYVTRQYKRKIKES